MSVMRDFNVSEYELKRRGCSPHYLVEAQKDIKALVSGAIALTFVVGAMCGACLTLLVLS